MAHPFNFTQGEKFSRMGASWFVSYCYDDVIPAQLGNWNRIRSPQSRKNIYERTKWWAVDSAGNIVALCETEEAFNALILQNPTYTRLHRYWMMQVTNMNDKKLACNSIGLPAQRVKAMARTCLTKL